MPSLCKYKFAFETVIWGRRILDLDAVLAGIAACGYDGVEFAQAPDQIFMRDPEAAKKGVYRPLPIRDIDELLGKLRQYGLELVSLAGGYLLDRMRFCGSEYRPPYLYLDKWDRVSARATRESFSANKHRNWGKPFTFGLHPHWFLSIQSGQQAVGKIETFRQKQRQAKGGNERADRLTLLPDTAHLNIVGEDAETYIADKNNNLAAIHLKDWRPSQGRYSRRYAQGFTCLGKGVVNLEKVLSALDHRSFTGWVVVEQDTAEGTPLESALACAHWLAERNWLRIPDPDGLQRLLTQEAAYPTWNWDQQFLAELAMIEESLLTQAIRGQHAFHQTVADSVMKIPGVIGVQFFNYSSGHEELYLLSTSGIDKIEGKTVISALVSPFRQIIRRQVVLGANEGVDDENSVSPSYDSHIAKWLTRQKGRMILVPIFNSSNTHHLDHILCLYVTDRFSWNENHLEHLGEIIAKTTDMMSDAVCSEAAAMTNAACGQKTSKAAFLELFHVLLLKQFKCEGGSIFLVDETGKRLLPVHAPGIRWESWIPQVDRCYTKGQGLTGWVWETGQMHLLSGTKASQMSVYQRRTDRSRDFRTSDRDECLIAPLFRVGGKIIGLVRLVNKAIKAGVRAATAFTDYDAAVMDAMIQAAIPHLEMLILQERQVDSLKRTVHEFQGPLVSIRGAVDYMMEELEDDGQDPAKTFREDFLGDILRWTSLMGNLAQNARWYAGGITAPNKQKTLLVRDVIAPAARQIEPLVKRNIHLYVDYGLAESFSEIPSLWIDRDQMLQVFFNLLVNSIKYGVRNHAVQVKITGGRLGKAYFIWFSDEGQGIEAGEEEAIFSPGFRAERAKTVDVGGQGIGLPVVRSIIEAHGGTIHVASRVNPTKFEIMLPLNLREPPVDLV